jgi:hypothetical protein
VRLPDPQRSRAVLIGTGRYADDKLPDLPVIGRTIGDLAAALTDPVYGIVPANHCTVLEDQGDIRLLGRHLRSAASDAEDLLLVYFVGHSLMSGRRQELYLGLPDSEWAEPEFNSLEYDKLRSAVLESTAATKIIILDCCFSGRVVSEAMADPVTEIVGQIEVDGTYVLASADRNQAALILPGEDYTAFTGRFLHMLRNGVPGGPELLTVEYLYRQLVMRMKAEGLSRPQRRGTSTADLLALAGNRAFAAARQTREDAVRRDRELAAHYTLACSAAEARDWDRALDTFTMIADVEPGYRDVQERAKNARQQRQIAGLQAEARRLHRAGQWASVVKAGQQLQALDPAAADPAGLVTSARAELAAEQTERRLASSKDAQSSKDARSLGRPARGLYPHDPRLLDGRYELDGVVGRGGMAEVYRARDIRLDQIVAIKTLRAELARDQNYLAYFRREAQLVASLNHPSIVAVYDTGANMATGVPVPYIVMEYLDGRTVRNLLQEGHRLPPERSLEIIDGVLRALDYGHQIGIVHRDIKPDNVMVTRNGDIKVIGFGIAQAMSDAQATTTQTAQVIGTAQYLSPEQARGERVDSRSDLYSTGCLLYELLTGRPPFTGDAPVAITHEHARRRPIRPSRVDPDVPAWADAIVLNAMAMSAAYRYQTAADMRADLQRAASGLPVTVRYRSGYPTTQRTGTGPRPANGENDAEKRVLLRLGRPKMEPEPEVPATKVVRQVPVRQARSKRSGKR